MKITYTENPLATIVELDEHEQKELWYKIKVGELEEMLFSVHYEVSCKKEPDMKRVIDEVDPAYYLAETAAKTKLDARVDMLLAHYLEELQEAHSGDCTAVACSCSKCHAETMIGIDTVKGLSKNIGYQTAAAFNYKDGDTWKQRTMTEALDILANSSHGHAAHAWVLAYRDEHHSHN